MDFKMLHEKAVTLARQFKKVQGELLDVLAEIDVKKVFQKLGYSSLWDYCLRGLKLAESDADNFIRIARKSQSVPELKKAVQQGDITLSAARRICSVITPENKKEWLDRAKTLPQRDLEREIVKENPKAKVADKLKPLAPALTELHCSISVEVEEMIRKVQDLESKRQRKNCSLEEAFREMALLYLERKDPIKKSERQKDRGQEEAMAQKATLSPVLRRTPNKPRHEVAKRDQGQCVFIDGRGHRCDQKRFTEVHHIQPYSIGGSHEASNLATLCSVHHKAIHDGVAGFKLAV